MIRALLLCSLIMMMSTSTKAQNLTSGEIADQFYETISGANDAWVEEHTASGVDWNAAKQAAQSTSDAANRTALQVFMNADRSTYLEYLDAKQWSNHRRIRALAETSAALRSYLATVDTIKQQFYKQTEATIETLTNRRQLAKERRAAQREQARIIRDQQRKELSN